MDTALILASIAAVHLLAVASPGPTLAVVTSYAIGGDRRSGAFVTLGVLLATLTWSSLAAAGLGTVIAHFSWAYLMLQLAGAAYLIYLGIKMLIGAARGSATFASHAPLLPAPGWPAVRAGFLTNITNPKTIAYYASLFGVMIPLDAPGWLFAAAVATALTISAAWWLSVTWLFSLAPITRVYARLRRKLDILMGGLLIFLGARLALSR